MKIKLCTPFFNENLIAHALIEESTKWVDEIHVGEANRTYQFGAKNYVFAHGKLPKVFHHRIDADILFAEPPEGRWPYCFDARREVAPFFLTKRSAFLNESRQRNRLMELACYADDDVVIICDVDEIIDPSVGPELVAMARKHEAATLRCYYTAYYFDLLLLENGGAPSWSYRVIAATGRYLRERWGGHAFRLRQLASGGALKREFPCLPVFGAFHHSWIGGVDQVIAKLRSFGHTEFRHLADPLTIEKAIRERRPLVGGLSGALVPCRELSLLPSIEAMRTTHPELFFV